MHRDSGSLNWELWDGGRGYLRRPDQAWSEVESVHVSMFLLSLLFLLFLFLLLLVVLFELKLGVSSKARRKIQVKRNI